MDAREVALLTLNTCQRQGGWSDGALKKQLAAAGLDSRDAALATQLCFGVVQNQLLLDFYLSNFSNIALKRMEGKVVQALRLGAYQLLFMDRVPQHAAVSEGVKLAKRHNVRAGGLVNAVLRRISENSADLPDIPGKGSAQYLNIKYSHPLWLCEHLIAEHGYDFAEALLAANNEAPKATAQVNTLKISADELMERLSEEGVECAKTAVPDSVEISGYGDMTKLSSFRDGLFYIQDNAAKTAMLTAEPKPGMRVLDACAAPGGKSFAAAIAMGNRGEIVSCDIHENKLKRINDSAKRLGIDIINTRVMDARKPDESFKDSFDLVIADVPCSGIGVIRKKPDIRQKSEEDILRLPEIQLDILRGLSGCVKPGGAILYSTCTILRRENQGVAEAFLKENSEFSLEGEMHTLYPNVDGTDGFFICKLRKKA